MSEREIIVTGSIGFDYIMNFHGLFRDRIMPDKIHQISLSFLVDRMDKQWGGTAGNIAYTLGLLGQRPILFATAGNDFEHYKKFLGKNGVDTLYIKEYKTINTGSYFVITDSEDNQIGAFYTGAMQHAVKLSLKAILKKEKSLVIIAPNDPQAMKKYVRECQELKIPYIYDPAFQIGSFTATELRTAISHAAILIGNDYEIELICKKLKYSKDQLLKKVPIIITTLGGKGATIEQRTKNNKQKTIAIKPAKPKNTSDPTGAGDAFRAGFIAGYIRGFDLLTCGQIGATAAVYTVEKYGTTTHLFTLRQFALRYKRNYQKELRI